MAPVTEEIMAQYRTTERLQKKAVDLDTLKFEQGGRLMSNKTCNLPKGSTKIKHKGYEEIYVPATRHMGKNEKLIKITEMPAWSQKAFPENIKSLNTI